MDTANTQTRNSNYNESDDDEYSGASVSDEVYRKPFVDVVTLSDVYGDSGEVESMDCEEKSDTKTSTQNDLHGVESFVREEREETKEELKKRAKIWFPKITGVFDLKNSRVNSRDEIDVHEITGRSGDVDTYDARMADELDLVYERCNAVAEKLGETGMHNLLLTQDYENGWNEFVRFVETIFDYSNGHEVRFYYGKKQTNVFKLCYDGNFDQTSMQALGWFSLGPSLKTHDTYESLLKYKLPNSQTWMRTLKNSGFVHVDVFECDYALLKSEKNLSKDDVYIFDKDFESFFDEEEKVTFGKRKSNANASKEENGSNVVVNYINDIKLWETVDLYNRGGFLKDDITGRTFTKLYGVRVNFIGQGRSPTWWNTKLMSELLDENLTLNLQDVENVQNSIDRTTVKIRQEKKENDEREKGKVKTGMRLAKKNNSEIPTVTVTQRSANRSVTNLTPTPNTEVSQEIWCDPLEAFLTLSKKDFASCIQMKNIYDLNRNQSYAVFEKYFISVVRYVSNKRSSVGLTEFFLNHVLPAADEIDLKLYRYKGYDPTKRREKCSVTNRTISCGPYYYVLKSLSLKENAKFESVSMIVSPDEDVINKFKTFVNAFKYMMKAKRSLRTEEKESSNDFTFKSKSFIKHLCVLLDYKQQA
jgi:hypothetical protein